MEKRVFDFSPGPAVLPVPALEEAQRNLVAMPGVGISILEISHRSATFTEIIEKAEANSSGIITFVTNKHHLRNIKRRFQFNYASLSGLTLCFGMALNHVGTFHYYLVLSR